MKSGWLLAAFCAASLAAPTALAQGATLYCLKNDALVRFNDAPLPAGDKSRWTNVDPATAGRCKLENGSEVVMRARQTQATAWGMGGANREAVFSLWVDRKKVVSREEFWPHVVRASHDFTTNHVLYSPGDLHVCRYAKGTIDLRKTESVTCARRSVDLTKLPVDLLEPKDDANIGKITVASTYNPEFCESFVARNGAKPDVGDYGNLLQLGRIDAGDHLAVGTKGQTLPFASGMPTTLVDRTVVKIKVAYFDMLNTGKPQTVVEFAGIHSMLSGNFFMVRDGIADETELKKLVEVSRDGVLHSEEMKAHAFGDWEMVQSRPGNYTFHTVILLAGTTFVLAQPFSEQDGPDAVLYRTASDRKSFEPVCTFQAVWPNL